MTNFTFLKCSFGWTDYTSFLDDCVALSCLSERNIKVLAIDMRSPVSDIVTSSICRKMADVEIPLKWVYTLLHWGGKGLVEDYELCGKCEKRGGICGYQGDSGLEIGCSLAFGTILSTSTKDAVIVGVGIPGLVCITGLAILACHTIKISRPNRLNSGIPSTTTVPDQQPPIRVANSLDEATIESYPTMVLGQSGRLARPSDDTCTICLCEYETNEILKSIPECNHYFHVGCINEWLKLNGTCPVCRNSPEGSSMTMACSSTPLPLSNNQ